MPAAIRVSEGDRFGRWTVLRRVPNRNEKRYWLCRCSCEKEIEREVSQSALRNGYSKSCGCLTVDATTERNLKHGMHYTPTHQSWTAMIARCHNPNTINYINYGGRGISVCERWRTSFDAFLEDMGERPEGMTLDRIDNEGNYNPGNCRWATKREQFANRRVTRHLEAGGIKKPITEWAEELGVSPKVIKLRLERGWTPEQSVNLAPPPNPILVLSYDTRMLELADWARVTGLTPQLIYSRINRGWTSGQALGFEHPPTRKPRAIEIACAAKPGERYGMWTVVEDRPRRAGMRRWLCRCDCGTEKEVQPHNLRRGKSISCGCSRRASAAEKRTA